MNKKEKIDKVKDLVNQVISLDEERLSDKLIHFVGGKGNRDIYHGNYMGKKAYLDFLDKRLVCWVTIAFEMNVDFVSKWKKMIFPFLLSKYKNVTVLPSGYLIYSEELNKIPVERIGVDEVRRCVEKLYHLARDVEMNQQSSVLATLTQLNNRQLEDLYLWG